MMNDIIMHINYGEEDYFQYGRNSIEDIVKMASDIGFDGIEFRYMPPNELSNLGFEAYVDEIARCKEKYGLKTIIMALYLADVLNSPENERDDELLKVVKRAEYANKVCGTTVFNAIGKPIKSSDKNIPSDKYECHGSAAASEKELQDTVNVFKIIGKEIGKFGAKLAFETHMNYVHDTPEATKKLVDMIDVSSVGINMDFGNTVLFPKHIGLEEAIDLYGDKLFYVHLKNSVSVPGIDKMIPISLSEGEINHRAYLTKLREACFEGPICIEAPRNGDRKWFAKSDFKYIKSVVEDIR